MTKYILTLFVLVVFLLALAGALTWMATPIVIIVKLFGAAIPWTLGEIVLLCAAGFVVHVSMALILPACTGDR